MANSKTRDSKTVEAVEEHMPEPGEEMQKAASAETAPVVIEEPVPAEPIEETVESAPDEATVVEEPPAAVAPAPAQQPRGGFVPLLLGGVIAAVLGAGATIYALPNLPPQLAALIPTAPPAASNAESMLTDQAAKIDALTKEIATLKSATPPAPDLSGVQTSLDEATAAARAVQDKVTALEGRIAALEARPAAGGDVNGDAAAALQGQIDALKAAVAAAGDLSASQQEIEAAAAEAKAKIDAAEQQATQLRNESETAAKRATAQAIAARISAGFDSGLPIAAALADAEAAGIMVPDVLKADVPTLAALQGSFPEAARAALAVSRKAEAGTTLGSKIGAFFMAQTGARSLEPQEGSGADAVLSRAQAAVDAGDLARALQEIGALPEAGKAAMSDWSAQAQRRLDAAQAVAALAQSVK